MIQPTELRIGNLVIYNDSIKDISCLGNKMGAEISPIEITVEILKKCNFKKCEDENAPGKCYKLNIGFKKDLSYCFRTHETNFNHVYLTDHRIKIDYLHQLQNFIFAYTGSELDVSKVIE